MNRKLITGLLYIAISAVFFIGGLGYQFNSVDNPGPALFPMSVSTILFVLGIASIIQSLASAEPIDTLHVGNIATIVLGLVGFAVAIEYTNIIVGTVVLVGVTSLSASTSSVSKNIKLTVGLVLVAVAFKELLGLGLPLWI